MVSVRPFRALRPSAALAPEIASVPYDVVDTGEARALAEGRPWSFLHVIRPEIDLPDGTSLYDDVVYDQARRSLEKWIADAPFADAGPQLLVYRLVQDGRAQIGVVGGCSVAEYDAGLIAIHERTRPAKEDDRTRHVVTMRCQAEPIFLAYRAQPDVERLVAEITQGEPDVDFVADDGVRHTVWTAPDAEALADAFGAVPRLYVADGHHRARSASRAHAELSGRGEPGSSDRVMAVMFPDTQLAILPYNRVVTDLGDRSVEDVLGELDRRFGLTPTDEAAPDRRHRFCVYGPGVGWRRFTLPPQGDGVISNLDCSLLQDRVLGPVFGIEDPRRDARIGFVGGSRGTAELERRADASGGVAFSMFATSLAELFAVADAGEIMPPKSTWFEPKLRSGLFVHRI